MQGMKNKKIILISLAVIVVAIAAYGVYWYISSSASSGLPDTGELDLGGAISESTGNPTEGLPETNPFETKTNPFDTYENPFE